MPLTMAPLCLLLRNITVNSVQVEPFRSWKPWSSHLTGSVSSGYVSSDNLRDWFSHSGKVDENFHELDYTQALTTACLVSCPALIVLLKAWHEWLSCLLIRAHHHMMSTYGRNRPNISAIWTSIYSSTNDFILDEPVLFQVQAGQRRL